jgi:hypothetical protein
MARGPREAFMARIEDLRRQRVAIDARIEENEQWLALLDQVEAQAVEAPKRRR